MSKIERRVVTAKVLRQLRPRLTATQRRLMAIIQLQKLADLHDGVATEATLWDLARDAFTWSYVAHQLDAGVEEMTTHLEIVTRMVEHFGHTGRVEFTSRAQDLAVRLGCAYMEDLAELTDLETAIAAMHFSEAQVNTMCGVRFERAESARC